MKLIKHSAIGLAVIALGLACAVAQDKNLSTLQRMGNTSTNMNIPSVPQEGKNADAIRANLKKVKLPDGFKIDLYAVVPDARYMAVAPSTNMLFVANVTYVLVYTNFSNPQRISLTSTPISLASDIAKARVYLSTDDGKIGYINPTNPSAGVTNLTQTSPARWGPLQRPNGMVVASTGFVYVVSQGDLSGNGGYISKIDTTTGIAEVLVSDSVGSWGSLPVGFCGPTGITIDSTNENIYVSNGINCSQGYSGYGNRNKILKIKLP